MNHKNSWTTQLIDAVDQALGHHTFGQAPTFDLKMFEEKISSLFPQRTVSLKVLSADYQKEEQILKFAGLNPTIISLEMAPIKAPFFISIPAEDVLTLSLMLISKEMKNTFQENELLKGFFKFFFLEVLKMFKLFNPYQGLSLRLSEEPLTTKESYCIELALSIDNIQSICRIILPLSFQHLFKEFYSTKKVPLKERLNFDQIPLICQLTLGSTVLKKQILDNLQIGDLLILDHASYQPKNKKGYFKLSYKHLPLFQVKLKEDQLKILDFISSGEDSYMDETDDMDHMDDMEEMAHLDEMGQEEDFDEMENNRSSFQEELMIDPSKVDLTVFCEVGKFEINLENLLQLKPGSIVPLSKRPEEGVYLTLNQKKIARGELVQLGDAVGVKITQTY